LKEDGCIKTFSDTASGKSMAGRPDLEAALAQLAAGDELVIAEWDQATRSMWDGLHIIKAVIDAGATILDRGYIDLRTPMGRGFMAMFSGTFSRPYLASGRGCRNGAVSANLVQYRSRCTARAVLLISLSSRHGSSA
jgi:DNA invertase Pin-like site-specific DNA recombinase